MTMIAPMIIIISITTGICVAHIYYSAIIKRLKAEDREKLLLQILAPMLGSLGISFLAAGVAEYLPHSKPQVYIAIGTAYIVFTLYIIILTAVKK